MKMLTDALMLSKWDGRDDYKGREKRVKCFSWMLCVDEIVCRSWLGSQVLFYTSRTRERELLTGRLPKCLRPVESGTTPAA